MPLRLIQINAITCICILLQISHASARNEDVVDTDEATLLSIALVEDQPQVDGTIAGGEWSGASTITGFYNHKIVPALIDHGPVLLASYDSDALHIAILTPRPVDRPLKADAASRDGQVFRDDSIEVYLLTPEDAMFQFVVNSAGALMDIRNNDTRWNGDIAAAASARQDNPVVGDNLQLDGSWWVAELTLPYKTLDTQPASADTTWKMQVGVNRPLSWAVLGPTPDSSYATRGGFVEVTFSPAHSAVVQLVDMGDIQHGRIRLRGRVVNPASENMTVELRCDAWKHGSYVTDDAYQEIVGIIVPGREVVEVPAGKSVPLHFVRELDDATIDRLAVRARQVQPAARPLLDRAGSVNIRPLFSAEAATVPGRSYAVITIDDSGLKHSVTYVDLEVLDAKGTTVLTQSRPVNAHKQVHIEYADLPIGQYECHVLPTLSDGSTLEPVTVAFRHSPKPAWWTEVYDRYANDQRVLKPWTPIEYGLGSLNTWGRTLSWQKDSILPASIISQQNELLGGPIRLVTVVDGKEYTAELSEWVLMSQQDNRGELRATGAAGPIRYTADMWIEYDGLLWITLTPHVDDDVTVERLYVEAPINRTIAKLYQGHAGNTVGWTKDGPIRFAWQPDKAKPINDFYHWFGNEGMGVGFMYRTLEHWQPTSFDAFTSMTPDNDVIRYRMHLADLPTRLQGRRYEFGIQATPVKPLPPDWHSMLGCQFWNRYMDDPRCVPNKMPEQVDVLLNWHPNVDMKGLNGFEDVNAEKMRRLVSYAHDKGMSITTPSICPQKIQPGMAGYDDYHLEWMNKPESLLTFDKITHHQNCAGAESYLRWLFNSLTTCMTTYDLDGVYFDGWPAGQMGCYSPHHGRCGWTDDSGERHLTVAVLEGRIFFRALAAWMEDHVNSEYIPPKAAPVRPGFPKYHFYVHTWCFVPPAIGFSTMWFTGEFACYPFRSNVPGMKSREGKFSEAVGMDMFLARCLSTNYGVPNLFDTLNRSTAQSQQMIAWLLPYGGQIGAPEYMASGWRIVPKVYGAMADFDSRRANFTPCWQENAHVRIVSPHTPDVVAATWDHGPDNVLLVVSNLHGEDEAEVTLQFLHRKRPLVTNPLDESHDIDVDERNRSTLHIKPGSYYLLRVHALNDSVMSVY